jgi:enoyl-CoA hydratase/carnithine racemase
MSEGKVSVEIRNRVGTITFFHPKKNSLPGSLLKQLADAISETGQNNNVQVIILSSGGDGPFCAGASFDELLSIKNFKQGKEFFMGFARVILAMKRVPKFVIVRVQGKTVGGGLGVISTADYALALNSASIKLSELNLGIGPFVIEPAVVNRIGPGAFISLTIDTEWRSADWAKNHSLFAQTFEKIEHLDSALMTLAQKLAESSPEAMKELKKVFWEGTEDWDKLMEKRAEISGRLVLSEFTKKYIETFRTK